MEQQEEVRVAWGTGIAGHVAESGEPVNIPDAYQVSGKFFFCIQVQTDKFDCHFALKDHHKSNGGGWGKKYGKIYD